MTANQIAFASVNESIRHNERVEEETERHNKATEELQKEVNVINQEKMILENSLGKEKNRIQEEYNKATLEWSIASGTKRLEIEQQQNDLRQQLNNIQEAYNIRSNELHAMEVDVKQRQVAETQRSNQAKETIELYSTMVNENLRNKELEYKKHELDVTSNLKAQELELRGETLATDVYFKNIQFGIEQQRADSYTSAVGSTINLEQNRIRWMPFQAGVDFFRAIGSMMQ